MAIKYRPIPDATESTLVLNSLQSFESGFYKCVISNDCGTATTTAAELAVLNGDEYSVVYVNTFEDFFDVCGISGAKTIILCPGTYTMTADLPIPENKYIVVLTGANIVTTGYTLTFTNAPDAGKFQIFSGSGTVVFGSNCIVYPEWWGGGDNVESATAISAAINSGASGIELTPGITYLVSSSITLPRTWVGKIFCNGQYATLKWDADTSGTMIIWQSSYTHLENIKLDGDGQSVKLIHIYEESSSNLVAGKYSSIMNVIFYNTASAGLWLGNYAVSGYDADIARLTLINLVFSGCYYGIYYDSINAQLIIAYNAWFSWPGSGVLPLNHISMIRGGQFHMYGGGFGGYSSDGTRYAIEVTDGWVELDGVNSEFGKTGTNGGGFLHLKNSLRNDAIIWPHNTVRNCKIYTLGTTTDLYVIRVDSASHPITVEDNWITRTNANAPNPALYNPGLGSVVSRGNLYYGKPYDVVTTSQGDIKLIKSTYTNIPAIVPNLNATKAIFNRTSGTLYQLTTDNLSNIVTNVGSTAKLSVKLPASTGTNVVGNEIDFIDHAGYGFRITPSSDEQIAGTSAANKYAELAAAVGNNCKLKCVSTSAPQWVVIPGIGTLTYET